MALPPIEAAAAPRPAGQAPSRPEGAAPPSADRARRPRAQGPEAQVEDLGRHLDLLA